MKNLKLLRQNLAKTQLEVAKSLNLPMTTYANYEQDKSFPPAEMLIKIADYFGCSIDYLLGHQTPALIQLDSFTPAQQKLVDLLIGRIKKEHFDNIVEVTPKPTSNLKSIKYLDFIEEGNFMDYKYKGLKIKRRADGRYEARKMTHGARKSIYGNTILECKENIDKYLALPISKKAPLMFYEWIDQWYNTYKKNLKQNTKESICSVIKHQIKPNIPDMPLYKITPKICNDCLNAIAMDNAKEKCSVYLIDIFNKAFFDGKTKSNIAVHITKYKGKRIEGVALTKEARKILVDFCKKDERYFIFIFYLFTGARKSEALNFTFGDILEDDLIRLPGTKTEGSNRILPKFNILNKIMPNQGLNTEKVFNLAEKTLQRRLNRIKAATGLNFAIKDLRTTFGTMCAELGIAEDVIAKWMGHTSSNTTKKYYIKVLTDFEKQQVALFDHKIDHNF